MNNATARETHVPLPSKSDLGLILSPAPIYIVTRASQLPKEFLFPSPEKHLMVGFDCEGVGLSRHGILCMMQLAFPNAIYLVDAYKGGEKLMTACKPALESSFITKIVHDCKRDSEALYFQFGIRLHNVFDTKIAYSLIEEQEGPKRSSDCSISFVNLLADPRYCGISYLEKKEIHDLLKQDPNIWTYRPLSKLMVRTAVDDVRFLPYILYKMIEKLKERNLWKLAVRGALHCRCFCFNDNGYGDWPSLPLTPDNRTSKESTLEGDILSVVDVPPGKMGCIIGKKGVSILSIKNCCNAEIILGGERGPKDKVFIIGPVQEVKKAEALIRGRF